MRNGYDQNGLFVDTGLLRDHVSKLREEKKTAVKLRDSIKAMRNCCDPEAYDNYAPVLCDVNQLVEYLERMARLLDEAGDEAVVLSREIAALLDEDAANTHYVASKAIML